MAESCWATLPAGIVVRDGQSCNGLCALPADHKAEQFGHCCIHGYRWSVNSTANGWVLIGSGLPVSP